MTRYPEPEFSLYFSLEDREKLFAEKGDDYYRAKYRLDPTTDIVHFRYTGPYLGYGLCGICGVFQPVVKSVKCSFSDPRALCCIRCERHLFTKLPFELSLKKVPKAVTEFFPRTFPRGIPTDQCSEEKCSRKAYRNTLYCLKHQWKLTELKCDCSVCSPIGFHPRAFISGHEQKCECDDCVCPKVIDKRYQPGGTEYSRFKEEFISLQNSVKRDK